MQKRLYAGLIKRYKSSRPEPGSLWDPHLEAHGSKAYDPFNNSDAFLSARMRRKSLAARWGNSAMSVRSIPAGLRRAIDQRVAVLEWGPIRNEAFRVRREYEDFEESRRRHTTQRHYISGVKAERFRHAQREMDQIKLRIPRYDDVSAMGYALAILPPITMATTYALMEVRKRLAYPILDRPAFVPKTIIDWGSGLGSVAWTALEQWPDLKHYIGVDKSPSMHSLANLLAPPGLKRTLLRRSFLDETRNVEHRGQKEPYDSLKEATNPVDPKSTMAVAAFTLRDLPTPAQRHALVESMWNSGAQVIVIIDRGSPNGFERVADARKQLLAYGRRHGSQDETLDVIDTETGEVSVPLARHKITSHVVAPCPHDEVCPMLKAGRDWCYFFHECKFLLPLHTSSSYDVADHKNVTERKVNETRRTQGIFKLSYVAIYRGPRPVPHRYDPSTLKTLIGSDVLMAPEDSKTIAAAKTDASSTRVKGPAAALLREESLRWPRILYHPLIGSKSTTFDACTVSGRISRWVVAKMRDGPIKWKDATKSRWGDLWPHEATSKIQERTRGITLLKPHNRGVNSDQMTANHPSEEQEDYDDEDDSIDLTKVLDSHPQMETDDAFPDEDQSDDDLPRSER